MSISNGKIRYIYRDDLQDSFKGLGKTKIARASHVEPNSKGQWVAQIIGGPKLGPFKLREDALRAEVEYLEKHAL